MYYTSWFYAQITEQRPLTMSVSLHTQTGLHWVTIQVLNTRVWFLDIWYISLTSVHYTLEHRLAIVIDGLVYSIWITQPPLSKSNLEVMQQTILFLFVMHNKRDQTD